MTSDHGQAHTKEFIILMAALMSVVAISIDALLPALGTIAVELRLANPNHAQYLISGLFGGMAVGQLISGPLSDALGRKKILYVGIGLYLVGGLMCYFAQSLDALLLGRVMQGLGVSGPYICAVSIVRDKFAGRDMARIMSIIMMIFILVPAIAPSFGQAILLYTSWRGIFVLYIVYALIVGAWIYFRLEETLPEEKRIPFHVPNILDGFRQVFTNRATMCYTICMGICFGSFMGYLNSSQQVFQDMFGAGKMFTVYFGGLALMLGVASMVNARFVEKLGMRFLCLAAFKGVIAASVVFLVLQGLVDIQLWMFIAYAAVLFFCMGLIFGNLNALAMEPMGHIAGIAAAVIGSSSSLMSFSIGAVIGQLYDGTLVPMTVGFMVLGITAWVFLFIANKNRVEPA